MTRRAFSLIELLAAIALVIALGLIALPAMQPSLARARVERVAADLEWAITRALIRARATGEPVAVQAWRGVRGTRLTLERIREEGTAAPESPAAPAGPSSDRAASPAVLAAVLPGSVELREALASGEDDEAQAGRRFAAVDGPSPVLLAVCLPDGSVHGRRGLQVIVAGEVRMLRVASWTGAVALDPIEPDMTDEPWSRRPGMPGPARGSAIEP